MKKIWEYASAGGQRCGLCMYCGYTVDKCVGCMTISVFPSHTLPTLSMCTHTAAVSVAISQVTGKPWGGGGRLYNNDESGDSPRALTGPIMWTLLMLVFHI